MKATVWKIIRILAATLPLAACGSSLSNLPLLENTAGTTADYHLGPGDRIHVQVFGAEDLSGDYLVGDNGTITSPLIGEITAADATRAEVERAIEGKLSNNIVKNPKVIVTVLTYRPFYIYGEVVKPGAYPFSSGIKVESAIATAGGFTYRSDESNVLITRKDKQYRARLITPILPDDIVRVPERRL